MNATKGDVRPWFVSRICVGVNQFLDFAFNAQLVTCAPLIKYCTICTTMGSSKITI